MQKIGIVGAGLVGSLLSVVLSKRGFTVDVFEKRPDMRNKGFIGGRSINLALSDRGWKALELVGLKDEIKKIALPMKGRMIHDEAGNTNLQAYGNEGQNIYSISRGMLNLALINATEPDPKVTYYFDQKCHKITRNDEVIFKNSVTGELKSHKYDVVIGADGAFSTVRNNLQKTSRFNYSQSYLPHGYKELAILPNVDKTHKLADNALHIWPRKSFMLIALPNLDGSFTLTLFLQFEGEISFESLNSDAKVKSFFERYFKDALDLMPNLIEEWHQNPTSSLVTIKCDPWHYKNNLILGDASHAIVPFYGQGMNSGFEDCTVLNDVLDDFDNDWEKAIPYYSKLRKPDADAISDLALRNFIEMRDSVIDPNFLLRKKIEKQIKTHFPNDYLPLYSMVTFSEMRYSDALKTAKKQDKMFEEVLQEENIEEKVNEGISKVQLKEWVEMVKNK